MASVPNLPPLADWLAREGARPVVWGINDCCLFVADWVAAVTGRDPGAAWRGTYRGERAAHRILSRGGGLLAVVAPSFDGVGLARTTDPLTGDIGVVVAPVAFRHGRLVERPVAAVRVGRLWAVKSQSGVAAGEFATLAAWRVTPEVSS